MISSRALTAAALGVVLCASTAARADQVDTGSLRLQGSRSEGGMLLPSSRVLDKYRWDLSLTYGHEGEVVRTRIPTGQIRGGSRSEEVSWLEDRDLMYLQFAASPASRLELVAGLPLLLAQTVSSDSGLEPPRSGATAFGDLRLGLRYALVGGEPGGWGATVQGGLLVPSGGNDYSMGDTQVRANLAGSFGFASEDGWSAHAHVGHQMGQMRQVGDQIFGDTVYGGLAFLYRHAVGSDLLQWSLEGVSSSVLSAESEGRDPYRSALELLGGARYFFDSFYVDAGAGVGAIDNGITPQWRVLASVGTTGFWGNTDPIPEPAPPPPPTRDWEAAAPVQERVIHVIEKEPAPDPRVAFRTLEVERSAIFFEVGRTELDGVAQNLLRSIALNLLESDRSLQITGFADDQGTRERNEELSRRRAEVVRAALVEAGVKEARLHVTGAGDTSPAAPSTEFGRSINRRVTFSVIDGDEK